jgi:phage repressor protein C with HTH and peptisase S24 domain
VPVHGTVVGGAEGDFEMNGAVVDYVRRPPGIAGTRDVFALYVTGDSMEPRYRPGDLVYVNPARPPRSGDDVVIELLPAAGSGAGPAFVKTLRARAPAAWICEQYNPPRQLEYPLERVRQVLRIMTLTELLGA